MRQIAIHHMKVCPAHRAGFHLNADLARTWRWERALLHDQRCVHLVQSHGYHDIASAKCGYHSLPERIDLMDIRRAPLAMLLP